MMALGHRNLNESTVLSVSIKKSKSFSTQTENQSNVTDSRVYWIWFLVSFSSFFNLWKTRSGFQCWFPFLACQCHLPMPQESKTVKGIFGEDSEKNTRFFFVLFLLFYSYSFCSSSVYLSKLFYCSRFTRIWKKERKKARSKYSTSTTCTDYFKQCHSTVCVSQCAYVHIDALNSVSPSAVQDTYTSTVQYNVYMYPLYSRLLTKRERKTEQSSLFFLFPLMLCITILYI